MLPQLGSVGCAHMVLAPIRQCPGLVQYAVVGCDPFRIRTLGLVNV